MLATKSIKLHVWKQYDFNNKTEGITNKKGIEH